ncbi:MAG: Smr/MutS family protein [Mangrovicoccus sp.]
MGRKGKRRELSKADRQIWDRVAGSVTPLAKPKAAPLPPVGPAEPPVLPPDFPKTETALPPVTNRERLVLGAKAPPATKSHNLAPSIRDHIAQAPVRMDRKAYTRMRRGKLEPEARIDLHGMTQAQAHPALLRFIQNAYARQFRLVLVITGKGKERDEPGPLPIPRGVLRHQVPHWLNAPPLRAMVLQITEAHLRHGGGGAYYVYLRRVK